MLVAVAVGLSAAQEPSSGSPLGVTAAASATSAAGPAGKVQPRFGFGGYGGYGGYGYGYPLGYPLPYRPLIYPPYYPYGLHHYGYPFYGWSINTSSMECIDYVNNLQIVLTVRDINKRLRKNENAELGSASLIWLVARNRKKGKVPHN